MDLKNDKWLRRWRQISETLVATVECREVPKEVHCHRKLGPLSNKPRFTGQGACKENQKGDPQMSNRHRVFVSYYHDEDQVYRDYFELLFSDIYDIMVSESVEIGDIDDTNLSTERIHQIIRDEYLRDSTVTVVLVGEHTWQRKFVDWEIGSSIRQTKHSSRSGLLGIILPTYPRPPENPGNYCIHTIPPRLHDNIECEYAKIYGWNDDPEVVQSWIHDAFNRRTKKTPDNSRLSFKKNRSGERWYD